MKLLNKIGLYTESEYKTINEALKQKNDQIDHLLLKIQNQNQEIERVTTLWKSNLKQHDIDIQSLREIIQAQKLQLDSCIFDYQKLIDKINEIKNMVNT